jgi:membrane dipeptidase
MRTRFVYETAHEAHIMAMAQVNYYATTGLRLIRSRSDLASYVRGWRPGKVAAVLLMEGADPVETPAQLGAWVERGVRIIGPAWGRTRYSGGTHAPGGLTVLGLQLLKAMRRRRVILDVSHLADEAVTDAFELWSGPIMASHSNARALVPGDRQITDATAAEIGRRGGVIGISFYEHHLRPSGSANLDDVVRHAVHIADAAGGPEHVALGTDLDGGFDAQHAAMRRTTDFSRLEAKLRRQFSPAQVEGVMGGNWLRFLGESLPA